MFLQLALDWGTEDDLFALADRVAPHVDWIEIGTPLIKQYGIALVARARKAFPKHILLADMKTADGGACEADLAADARADVMTVLAAASDATIREAITRAKQRGIQVVVDLIGQPDPLARAKQIAPLQPHFINLHRSTDASAGGAELQVDVMRELVRQIPIPLSVAGAINLKSIDVVRTAGAAIVVVGSAITTAADPVAAAKALKEKLK